MGFKTKASNFIDKVFGKDIVVEINGVAYSNFLSVNVSRSLETVCNEFEFSGTVEKLEDFPISLGDSAVIFFHGVSVVDGYVETIVSQYSNDGHTVAVSGRDRTADIVDGSVFQPLIINGDIKLKALLDKLLKENGITDIDVIDLASPDGFTKKDQVNIDRGANLFDVVDKYCSMRQVLATTDGLGRLVITRGGVESIKYSDKIIHIANQLQSGENNVLNASKSQTQLNRYNKYIVQCQEGDITAFLDEIKSVSGDDNLLALNEGIAFDPDGIRDSRTLVIVGESLGNAEVAKDRAKWEASVRRARSFEYTCSLQGFLVDKTKVWSPNSLVRVTDERLDIDDDLLIRDVSFLYDLNNGSITELTLVQKDAYDPQPNVDEVLVGSFLDAIQKARGGESQ
jgi:prophage tail gpP-like protein